MLVRVYRIEPLARSVFRAVLLAEVEVDRAPEDPLLFADHYGGDFIQIEPVDPEEEAP